MKFLMFAMMTITLSQSAHAADFGCVVQKMQQAPWKVLKTASLAKEEPAPMQDGPPIEELGFKGFVDGVRFIVRFTEDVTVQVVANNQVLAQTQVRGTGLPAKRTTGFYFAKNNLYQLTCE